jgi:hypothetical protein
MDSIHTVKMIEYSVVRGQVIFVNCMILSSNREICWCEEAIGITACRKPE